MLYTGSIGAGISLLEGVTTTVKVYDNVDKSSYDISINGKLVSDAVVSSNVIDQYMKRVNKFFNISVSHETRIPIGYGLGTSGAGALSLSFALNNALCTGLCIDQVAQIAHCSEIYCNTGLGTVISEFTGGLELRIRAGAPGIGKAEKIILENKGVVALCLRPMYTARCLSVQNDLSTMKAVDFLKQLLKSRSVEDFLRLSHEFAHNLGAIKGKCKAIVKLLRTKGYESSVALFGETIFTIVSDNEIEDVLQLLKDQSGYRVVSKVDNFGAKLLANT
ncbi:MAG: hypothetical protein M3O24_03000 [Thermoproteota archaeon]|nr:hypothetical protein [Thermoproteota archaeon]